MADEDDNIDGHPGDFLNCDNNEEVEFGHNAHGSSPLAASTHAPLKDTLPPILGTTTSPSKWKSTLCSTSFLR
jgi:hypothetical protein